MQSERADGRGMASSVRFEGVPLFAGLSRRELDVVAGLADEVDAEEGRVLIRQGALGREVFVIEAGTAEVTCDGEVLRTLGRGDFFGEIALIENVHRTATVTATSPMRLLVLTAPAFRALRHTMPRLHETVRREIRLRARGR
ncbi:MAG TPA: cyclic nucleotide-binding domain-containing protein [Solirubrobacteraceae bacterium]